LHVVESPIVAPREHNFSNYQLFSDVLTYNRNSILELENISSHFRLHFCNLPFRNLSVRDLGFGIQCFSEAQNRRLATIIAGNRSYGIFSHIRNWPFSLKNIVNERDKQWAISVGDYINYSKQSTFTRREKIVQAFDRRNISEDFDVYGAGWRKEDFKSRFSKLVRYASPNANGSFQGATAEVFARYRFAITFENWTGNWGYVSEKAFACFDVGTIPIYLGDAEPPFPDGTYIDARRFRSYDALVLAVESIQPDAWREMSMAGMSFSQEDSRCVHDRFFDSAKEVLNVT